MKIMLFNKLPSFKILGFYFWGNYEFKPALGLGLMFSLSNSIYLYFSFMGLNINYYIQPD